MTLSHLKDENRVRGILPADPLSVSVLKSLTAGFLSVFSGQTGKSAGDMTIAVGVDDARVPGKARKAVAEQLLVSGADVSDFALCAASAMLSAAADGVCDGAIQLTAVRDNGDEIGLLFFSRAGVFDGDAVSAALRFAETFDASPYCERGVYQSVDYMSQYGHALRNFLREEIKAADYRHPLRGRHIIVYADSEATAFFALHVLRPLGADVTESLSPLPDSDRTTRTLRDAVARAHADLGVFLGAETAAFTDGLHDAAPAVFPASFAAGPLAKDSMYTAAAYIAGRFPQV